MTDQELRAELAEALTGIDFGITLRDNVDRLRSQYGLLSAHSQLAIADALLPVVRAHLAQAWDRGYQEAAIKRGKPWRFSPNPWREDDQ